MFTDPNGESPSSSPLRKKNSHGGDRVSAKWKAKKAAEVLALSSCSPKRKQRKIRNNSVELATCVVEQVGGTGARVHQRGTGDLVPVPI